MNDDRFEAWWNASEARRAINPAGKEVARTIWRAAQQDLVAELGAVPYRPHGRLWVSPLRDRTELQSRPLPIGQRLADGEEDDAIPLCQPRTTK